MGSNSANENLALPFQVTQVHLQSDQVPAAKHILERPDTTKQQPSVLTAIDPIMQLKIAGFYTRKKAKTSWLARNQVESAEQPINLPTIGTLHSDLVASVAFSPT